MLETRFVKKPALAMAINFGFKAFGQPGGKRLGARRSGPAFCA